MTEPPAIPTIAALHAAYAAGLDPGRVIAESYRRIAAADDPGIFIALVPEAEALAAAGALGAFDPAGRPLWGVPFAVKDNIDLAGLPTTAACPDYAYRPTASAAAVTRLVAAGAIPIGKTNLDQFATGLVGVRIAVSGVRATRSTPPRAGRVELGFGGRGRRGLVPLRPGTDTAGSGRVPAGINNIVGLKPSLRRGLDAAGSCRPAARSIASRSWR